jgi:hypothetical protein
VALAVTLGLTLAVGLTIGFTVGGSGHGAPTVAAPAPSTAAISSPSINPSVTVGSPATGPSATGPSTAGPSSSGGPGSTSGTSGGGAVNSGVCTPVNNATGPVSTISSSGSGSGAFLNIDKAAVPNCSKITLAGGGFAANETVYLQEKGPAGENIGQATPVTANASGDIGPLSYIVMADGFNTGGYSISATGANPSGGSATQSINIEQT